MEEAALDRTVRPRADRPHVVGTGTPPTLPDLVARRLQHRLVGRVLPRDQLLDDAEQPLALLSCASSVGNNSGRLDGSSTICAKITARAAASGRRAHHRCSVLGCPCRIDFSRAEALFIASRGSATSISFFRLVMLCLLSIRSISKPRPPAGYAFAHLCWRQPAPWMSADRFERRV